MHMKKRKSEPTEQISDNKPLDKKKLIPRLVAFLIFFALSVTFITIGVTRLGHKDEGLQEITAEQDPELPMYQLGVRFQHYFSGSSNEIKMAAGKLGTAYAGALKDLYRMLNARTEFEGWNNLATLSRNPGQEFTLSRELFDVLVDADRRTRAGEGFNLYAGAFYAEWESIRYLLTPQERDPLADPDEAARLEALAKASSDLSAFSLEIVDISACRVRFNVREDYLDLLRRLELEDAPILDLNVLADAYKLQLLAKRMEEAGYHNGYLTTDSGITLALSGYKAGGDYAFVGLYESRPATAASRPVKAGSCAVQLRAFASGEDEPGYYGLEQDGALRLRHPFLPADGVYRELLLSCFVYAEGKSPTDTVLAALKLLMQDDEASVMAQAKADPAYEAALILRSEPMTVYTDAAMEPGPDYGFSVKPLR